MKSLSLAYGSPHPFLAARLLNRPLALLPSHAAMLFDTLQRGAPEHSMLLGADAPDRARMPYAFVQGVAVISVAGCLVHDCDWIGWGEQTPYTEIASALAGALRDDRVRGIALHIDSPGGDVAGCFDLADAVYAARGIKPIWAICNETCYSAAYALASAADRIMLPRTGGAGSIGIIYQHVSIVNALDTAGIVVSTFTFGDRKADAYPTSKMAAPAAERIQADIDMLGEMFIDTVARNRNLATAAVRGTQAGTFLGAAAVEAGLADAVSSADDAFLDLLKLSSTESRR